MYRGKRVAHQWAEPPNTAWRYLRMAWLSSRTKSPWAMNGTLERVGVGGEGGRRGEYLAATVQLLYLFAACFSLCYVDFDEGVRHVVEQQVPATRR
jgi:hypothetical protein